MKQRKWKILVHKTTLPLFLKKAGWPTNEEAEKTNWKGLTVEKAVERSKKDRIHGEYLEIDPDLAFILAGEPDTKERALYAAKTIENFAAYQAGRENDLGAIFETIVENRYS